MIATDKEKLSHVHIEGFKSIRELDIDLGNLTVLIGANGSGKSNFVQFFQMLNFMLSGNLQNFIGRKGGGQSLLHYGAKKTRAMDTSLAFQGADGWSRYEFSLSFAVPESLLFTNEQVVFQKLDAVMPFQRQLGSGHKETLLIDLATENSGVGSKVAQIFQKRLRAVQVYHFHDTTDEAYIRTRQDIDRNRFLMGDGANLAAFLYMLRGKWPDHYKRILATVQRVVPYLKDFILDPGPSRYSRPIMLEWSDRSGEEFGPHQLSDGSLRAVALITALMQPEELLPSVILIDEPELGLHPSAVGLISTLLQTTSLKTQVIVATQSPQLLENMTPEQVVVVERRELDNGRGESTFKRLNSDELAMWLEDYSLSELFEKNVTGGWPQ